MKTYLSDVSSLRRVFLYAIYASILSVAFRFIDPPPLRFDDGFFLLISYSWLNGLGFKNFWYSPISSTIFNWHGFLQPILIAKLSPCRTLQCLNDSLIGLGCIYLAVWYVAVNACGRTGWLRWALYAIGISLVLSYSARPELLASLELIGIVLLFYYFPDDRFLVRRAIIAGVAIALALVTDPVAGMFAGLGVAAAAIYTDSH